jgi:hypothetical protein
MPTRKIAPLRESDGYRYDDSDKLIDTMHAGKQASMHDKKDVKDALLRGVEMPSGSVVNFYGFNAEYDTGQEAQGGDGNTGGTATGGAGRAG